MLPTTALQQLAYYAAGVTGLACHYPAPATVNSTPCLLLFWDETELAELTEQRWMMTVKGFLLLASRSNPVNEILVGDSYIAPLVDRFSPNANPRNAYHLRDDSGDGVDYCRIERVQPSQPLEYAGNNYYGSEIYWGIKLRRFAGSN